MALTRRPTPTPVEPLTPALIYLLVCGDEPSVWLPGWVALAQDMRPHDVMRRVLWPSAGDQIKADTAPYGFAPWGQTGCRPTGPAVAAWARAFVATHGRRA